MHAQNFPPKSNAFERCRPGVSLSCGHMTKPIGNSSQAPMMEAVEYEWKTWDVTNSSSTYVGNPNPETEMKWDYLWQCKLSL